MFNGIHNTEAGVSNAANWVSTVSEKVNTLLDAVQKQGYTEIEVDIPFEGPLHNAVEKFLGRTIADHIAITVKVKIPKITEISP